jgi:uncharacterized protein YdaT
MAQDTYHVVPHTRGWAVKRSGARRASKVYETKRDAVARGKELAQELETELVVHDGTGRVGNPNSYGNDRRSVRDKRR